MYAASARLSIQEEQGAPGRPGRNYDSQEALRRRAFTTANEGEGAGARGGTIGWRCEGGAPGGALWVDWLTARGRGSRGRAQGSLAGEAGAGLQRARAFVAVMEETGAVFRKVRKGVLAGRVGGAGRGFCGWGTRTGPVGTLRPLFPA